MHPPASEPAGSEHLSPRSELVLLALFVPGSKTPRSLHDLWPIMDQFPIGSSELIQRIEDLWGRGLVNYDAPRQLVATTELASALVSQLALDRLTPNIRRQRTEEEQAEALIIWRLQQEGPPRT